MDKEGNLDGLKKKAVEPFNELWKLLWKYFKWGERTQEEWDEIMTVFSTYAERYKGTEVSYLIERMSLAYLDILQWSDTEGKRKNPYQMQCMTPKTKEEIIRFINEAEKGDEIIIKGNEIMISTRIK